MSKLLAVLVLAAALAGGYFSVRLLGPGLIRDWRLRDAETVAVGSQLGGDCRVLVAINVCIYRLRTPDATLDDLLVFVGAEPGIRGYDIVARAEVSDRRRLTSSLALSRFWNRLVTLAAFVGLMALLGLACARHLLKRNDEPAT